jgi:threonine synthase
MNYTSTRKSSTVNVSDVIMNGISEEGGLFVPKELPKLKEEAVSELVNMSYSQRAFEVLKLFLDFSDDDLRDVVDEAYSWNFKTLGTTRLVKLDNADDSVQMLELWHGPTAAFKDMALQVLPGLLSISLKKAGKQGRTLILVATSGDTGKAALEGFKNVEGIDIAVFYPQDGVSDTQKLQMQTQEGDNVHVFAVKGNFDDCQNAVKEIFTDSSTVAKAKQAGVAFSSANSINWGRLCPQIAYYVSSYAELIRNKSIKYGDKINICVPTGNFGNILAAYYAMEMGIPVAKLICASNSNNVLTDLINNGVYDMNRDFHTTVSPSMDILVSSNLERLLYHICGNDDKVINELFTSLKEKGKFEVDKKTKTKLKSLFYGSWCSEEDTTKTIKEVFDEYGYLMDTHTAVGYKVWKDYNSTLSANEKKTKTIIASTASPYKFSEAVYEALYGEFDIADFERFEPVENDEYGSISSLDEADGNEAEEVDDYAEEEEVPKDLMDYLEERTGIVIPKALSSVKNKEVRFNETIEASEIKATVTKIINS